jgi:guanylate kinase
MMPRSAAVGRVYVVSSPSGGGKTTVVAGLRQRIPRLGRSISMTTRARRPGERDGRHYRFVSPAAFQRLRRAGQLLEWARVHGAYYGTPKAPIVRALARGRSVVLSIDVQGARQIRRVLGPRAVLIFLLPPPRRELRQRLLRRRTDSPAAIRRRLAAARREVACAAWYDHQVASDRLAPTVRRMQRIIAAHEQRKGR